MSHTPEPWRICTAGDTIEKLVPVSEYGDSILTLVTEGRTEFAAVYSDDDAKRIVACVNACKGFSTEQLVDIYHMGGMAISVAKIGRLQNTINDLVSAMEDLMGSDHPVTPVAYFRADELVSQIKSAGGAV